ncbi:MAG: hypothetical protein IT379_18645 [Deltaproteobacteria bacterium]|nr:hypothetical protein [Deltaproteobacteria bacterium]
MTRRRAWRVVAIVAAVAAPSLMGCGEDEPAVEDPSEHACEHRSIAGAALASSAERATAPTITVGEETYTVTPSATERTYLRVVVTRDTPALLFTSVANVVTGLYEGDAQVTLPAGAPNELCAAEIPEHFDLDFHEAGDWFIELGPSAVPSFWLLLTEATGHAHEALVQSPSPPAAR